MLSTLLAHMYWPVSYEDTCADVVSLWRCFWTIHFNALGNIIFSLFFLFPFFHEPTQPANILEVHTHPAHNCAVCKVSRAPQPAHTSRTPERFVHSSCWAQQSNLTLFPNTDIVVLDCAFNKFSFFQQGQVCGGYVRDDVHGPRRVHRLYIPRECSNKARALRAVSVTHITLHIFRSLFYRIFCISDIKYNVT